MRTPTCAVISVLLAAAPLLAQNQTKVSTAPGLDPSRYVTFEWKGPAVTLPDDGPAVSAKAQAAIDAALKGLGYTESGDGASDLVTSLHIAPRDSEALSFAQATLVVDLIDAKSGVLVWRSFDSDLEPASLAKARFANVATYSWRTVPTKPGLIPSYQTTERRLRSTVEAGLLLRGYTVAAAGSRPDFQVVYRVIARSGGGKKSDEAALLVELLDSASGQLLWRGETSAPTPKPSESEDAIIDAIAALLRAAPGKGAAAGK
jgi:hypothetical protein